MNLKLIQMKREAQKMKVIQDRKVITDMEGILNDTKRRLVQEDTK